MASKIEKIIDKTIEELGKLEQQLKKAEEDAKTNDEKGKIAKIREKVNKAKNELKDWKKKPNAAKALDILIELLKKLSGKLPPPIEKFVKAYLEALAKSMGTAYSFALKNMENYLKGHAQDPDNPTDEEIDEAAKNSTNNKEDQEWVKFLWKLKQAAKKAAEEKPSGETDQLELINTINALAQKLQSCEAKHIDDTLKQLSLLSNVRLNQQKIVLDKLMLEELKNLLAKLQIIKSSKNLPPEVIRSILEEVILLLTKLVLKVWLLQGLPMPKVDPKLAQID